MTNNSINRLQKLMKRCVEEITLESSLYVTVAIDHTANTRLNSPTLKDRGYHHSPNGFQKVTEGHGYSTIAWIPEDKGSWALPLRHERITSFETPITKAAWQLKQVAKSLNNPILALLDSEYGNASWVNQTVDIKADCLIRIRKKYLRRFAVDHWYRFIKQRLHWTLPALSTPHQCERWSDLMPLMTWQLWLARELVEDTYLPWQKPQKNLSPGRVAQSMLGLLVEMGTPAQSPKPRGKSPGWETPEEKESTNSLSSGQKTKKCREKTEKSGYLNLVLSQFTNILAQKEDWVILS